MKPRPSFTHRAKQAMSYLFGSYEATGYSREREWWPVQVQDWQEDVNNGSRIELMSHARRLYKNSGLAKHATDILADYTIGTGWIAQSRTGDPVADQAYEDYFANWEKICDVRGLQSFDLILKNVCRNMLIDGDVGIILTKSADDYPRLQAIPSHRIADDPKRDDAVQGVLTNAAGRPIAYRIRLDDGSYQDVSAINCILFHNPTGFDQLRGVTAFHTAINHLRDQNEIVGFEKQAVKELSATTLIEKNHLGEAKNPFAETSADQVNAGALPTQRVIGGTTRYLSVGEDVQAIPNDRPSPAWQGLMRYLAEDICVGLNLPYEFVMSPDKLSGAPQRWVITKAQRTIQSHQMLLMPAASRIFVWVIALGIKRGELPLAANWWRHEWQLPSLPSIDYSREAVADQNDYKLGLKTAAEIYAERGLDWEAEFTQKCREQKRLLELCAEFGVNPQSVQLLTPNGNEQTGPAQPKQEGQ